MVVLKGEGGKGDNNGVAVNICSRGRLRGEEWVQQWGDVGREYMV